MVATRNVNATRNIRMVGRENSGTEVGGSMKPVANVIACRA